MQVERAVEVTEPGDSGIIGQGSLPTTIDGVIERMSAIVRWSESGASRVGYFAGLYRRVTLTIRDLLGTGYFDDDARMERLDVKFACRYLAALDDYTCDGPRCTAPWRVAFDEVADPRLLILQQLLLGMNAHIELDLGIAVAEIAPGRELDGIRGDFDKINSVLAALSPLVETELGSLAPLLRVAEFVAKPLERPVVDLNLWLARHTAWDFAKQLASLDPKERAAAIEGRAATVGIWAREMSGPNLLVRTAFSALALTECGDVRRVIRHLSKPAAIDFEGRRLQN